MKSTSGRMEESALQISSTARLVYESNKIWAPSSLYNAVKAVIIGSDELSKGEATLKDLDSGAQKNVALDKIVEELR